MLGQTLAFLRAAINAQLEAKDSSHDEPSGDPVVFLDGAQLDPPQFARDAITLLLVNVEEQRLLRAGGGQAGGDLQLNLHVLFVARFGDYTRAWDRLAEVIRYFQDHRVITGHSSPAIPDGIDQLVFELVTQDLTRQNDLWATLRTAQHPSLLYKVGVVTMRRAAEIGAGEVEKVVVSLREGNRV